MVRLAVLTVALLFSAVAAAAADPPGLSIRIEGGLLTLKATEVPHRLILETLAERLGFRLVVAGALSERRSLTILRTPWEEALKGALLPANWAFVYESAAGRPRLVKVFVSPASPAPHPAAPARVSSLPGISLSQQEELWAAVADVLAIDIEKARPGEVMAALAELLVADDEEVRAVALMGLSSLGGEQAVRALTRGLLDEEPWLREMTVAALAELGGQQAIAGLQQALQDPDAKVRHAAQAALRKLLQGAQ